MKWALVLLLLLPACATLMTGHTDYIKLASEPTGAAYKTNGGLSGITPAGITVHEKETVVVTFSKDGYQTTSIQIPSKMSAWVWGNIIIGGVIGFIIDIASDGMETHRDRAFASLDPIQ